MQASAAIENAAAETTVQPPEDSTPSRSTSNASTPVGPLPGVEDEQSEVGGNGSGAALTVPADTDPIVDPVITAAAVSIGLTIDYSGM